MKKLSKILAFILALLMIAGSVATLFAVAAEENEVVTPWDESVEKLYEWGIIDSSDVEASKDITKKLDRNIFAVWMARILVKEFGWAMMEEMSKHEDKAAAEADGFKTVYDDVNNYEGALYRRAVEYVTASGLFEGYGIDEITKENNFGPVYKVNPDGSSEGAVELYQACKVIIALLSRWTDELNSKYVDDVHAYMEYLGDSSLMGMGTAYLWKASELGMIDSKYMNNCREYFWDAELNYGETAYILVKAIEGVLPAGCDGEECPHGGKADKNGNGVIDCYIEDIMRAGESDETLSGIVLGPDPSLDVLGSEEVNLGIFVGGNTHVEIKFTAEEFMKMAVLTDGKVDLTAGENGYEVNTLVSVKYHGDASITEKTADRITDRDKAALREGILAACDGAPTVVPTSGYSVYNTYLTNKNGHTPVLSEREKVTFTPYGNKLIYMGVEYTLAAADEQVDGNKLVARICGIDRKPEDFAEFFKNLAEGEVKLVFCDTKKEAGKTVYEYVELIESRDFASLHVGVNDIRNNGKTYSYVLYNKSIDFSTAADIRITDNKANGLMIALFNHSDDGRRYPCYKYVDLYASPDASAKFKTVNGVIKSVTDSAIEGYYEVTMENGTKVLVPTSAKLSDTMNMEFFYNVGGDWASQTIDINTNYKNTSEYKSWFKDLVSAYEAMTDDKAQLVAKKVEIVYSPVDGKAVYVVVESADKAQEGFGIGYISKVEKTEDKNIVEVTLNKVCAGGAISAPRTFKIDIALTASYNCDTSFIYSLLKTIIDPTASVGMASYEQLIFAEVKNDGTGRYILVKVKDVAIGFSTPSASTILGDDIFVSSTIYDAAGNVLGVFTDAEVKSFTQEYISKGAEKIVTLKSKYIAESYAYFAVKDEEGNITGYKLQPKVIKAVQQKYTTYRNNGSTVTESGETHTVEMQDGKWNIPGISDYGMAVNAEMTSSVFTVNGVTVVSNTDGYMVHVITPSAEGETFVFGTYTASEYVGKHKILKYAVDITEKTITVYGE